MWKEYRSLENKKNIFKLLAKKLKKYFQGYFIKIPLKGLSVKISTYGAILLYKMNIQFD